MKKLILCYSLILSFSAFANSTNCHYQPLTFSKNKAKKAASAKSDGLSFNLIGAKKDFHAFEGPLKIYKKNKLRCSFTQGILTDVVYYERTFQYLMIKSYNGDCGEFRIYSLESCKEIATPSPYCGNAIFDGKKLVSDPICELVNAEKNIYSCSSGKVYEMAEEACIFEFSMDQSKTMTKRAIGQEIPLHGKTNIVVKMPVTK